MLFDRFNQLLKALHCIHVTAQFQPQRGAAVMLSWAGCSFCLRAKQVCGFHLSLLAVSSSVQAHCWAGVLSTFNTSRHRIHNSVWFICFCDSCENDSWCCHSVTDSTAVWPPYRAQSIITVRITCWVNGSCCSEFRHHSHTCHNVNDVDVLSTAVDSCVCCSVPTDQITFIQDVGQMSLRRFSSRYHTLSFTVKQHRTGCLYCHYTVVGEQVEQEWLDWGVDDCLLSPAVWSLLLFFSFLEHVCRLDVVRLFYQLCLCGSNRLRSS